MNGSPLIQIQHISKAYDGVQALTEVSFDIAPGEIHALVGENGAGKSTLIKILSGSVEPDSGKILVAGETLELGEIAAAEGAGIAVIHQEIVGFPHLNTIDNIFVGREPRRWGGLLLDKGLMQRETQSLLERLGERFEPTRPVGELPLAQRQMVGIARSLSRRCRLLIMDEPTSALSARETEVLFRIIRRMKSEGVSVLYVSHRLEEVFHLADRVTVLRDGRHVSTTLVREIEQSELIKRMVGRELLEIETTDRPRHESREILLDVRDLTRRGAFENVSFQVRAGEIVGIAGLIGAGRSEVAETIFGVYRADAGSVHVAGNLLRAGSVAEANAMGVALVPEDRQQLGLVLPMSVRENLTLAVLRTLTHLGVRSVRRERAVAERLVRELQVRTVGTEAPAQTLSGGNQQKLVLGKWLAAEPRVLILDEPTRGVDVGAKAEIYRLIQRLAQQGMATLLISSELPEILALSDRILIMRSGSVAGELSHDEATQEKILELALPRG